MFRATNIADHALQLAPATWPATTHQDANCQRQRSDALGTAYAPVWVRAQSVPASGAENPGMASARAASYSPAPTDFSVKRPTLPIDDYAHPLLSESAPFHQVGVDVRRANKTEFEPARQRLKKEWPDFDKQYDAYRRWRDSPPNQRKALQKAGMAAQLAIMQRSGVSGSEQIQLFKLLSNPPSPLLRFVSPINGDFRAPKQGVIAGFRHATDNDKQVPTLAFPGTGSGSMIRAQMRANYKQFVGQKGLPDAHALGILLARHCHRALSEKHPQPEPLAFTGHSLGGGIATCAAADVARPDLEYTPTCYAFNPAALGGATQMALSKLRDLEQRVRNHKIIRVKNDHVSSPAMQKRLAAIISTWTPSRITVPQHIGQVYVIRRDLLEKPNQNLLVLHKLEALSSVYAKARSVSDRPE